MKNTMVYSLRQIKIPNHLYLKLKCYCKHQKITLMHFYEKMLDWFFRLYLNDNKLLYQASSKYGRVLSLWICDRHIEDVQKMSRIGNVSDARVIYTAMMLFLASLPEFNGLTSGIAEISVD